MTQWNSPGQAERFVSTYADPILRLSLTYSLTREDAQDICQDIFLKLLEEGREFQDLEHEKAFVLRAAINRCKDLLKSARRRRNVPMEEAERLPAPPAEAGACRSTMGRRCTCFITRGTAWTRWPGCAAVARRRPESG